MHDGVLLFIGFVFGFAAAGTLWQWQTRIDDRRDP
jgi:hypothetical protein